MVKFTNLAFLEVIIRFFVRIFLFFGVLTGFLEEICQIHFISAVGIFGKSDRLDQGLVVTFRIEERAVNAAEIDKIQRGTSHNEHGLKFIAVRNRGEVQNFSALAIHLELTNALQLSVDQSLVSQQLRVEGNGTTRADQFLLFLGLNG